MGTTKLHNYNKKQLDLAAITHALAHPARIAILQFISKQKSCICGSIVDELSLSQATISQHLKVLKDAGLLKGTISGASTCYCINEKEWEKAQVLLLQFMNTKFNSPNKTCC
jgi:hypothetical protein